MSSANDLTGSSRPDHPVDVAHYLRQATITRLRHSSIINHVWYKHRHAVGNFSPWKH